MTLRETFEKFKRASNASFSYNGIIKPPINTSLIFDAFNDLYKIAEEQKLSKEQIDRVIENASAHKESFIIQSDKTGIAKDAWGLRIRTVITLDSTLELRQYFYSGDSIKIWFPSDINNDHWKIKNINTKRITLEEI